MTVDADTEAEVRRLFYGEHWKQGTIVSQLGLHADVVTRVLNRPCSGSMNGNAHRLLVPDMPAEFKAFIGETLATYPKLVGTRVFDMLVKRGYEGGLRQLQRYLRHVRPLPKHDVYLRVEPLKGEQAQVDWGHVGYLNIDGRKRALWVFVMVLAYSREIFAELVLDLSAYSLRRSLVRAVTHFQGCPRQWVFDNPKIVVLERRGDVVRFHPLLLDLAGAFCVQLRLCGVRKPHEKGKVERAIRYLKQRFFAAREIHSIEHGNGMLEQFLREVADERRHPRCPDRLVRDLFDEEKAFLMKLPSALPETNMIQPVVVDKTAFVRFDGNFYSAPPKFARQTLTLVVDDRRVRLLHNDEVVASHTRSWSRRQYVEEPSHRKEILELKRAGRQLKRQDRLRSEVPEIDGLFARWIQVGRQVSTMTTQTIHLLDLYGAEIFTQAVRQVVSSGTHDPSALARVCEQERIRAARPMPNLIVLASHVADRDIIPHDLGGYDE